MNWSLTKDSNATLAAAVLRLQQDSGRSFLPVPDPDSSDPCDTDMSRPGFIQRDNTLLRSEMSKPIRADPTSVSVFWSRFSFREAVGRCASMLRSADHCTSLEAEGVRNLAYDYAQSLNRVPANNYNALQCDSTGQNCTGGSTPR